MVDTTRSPAAAAVASPGRPGWAHTDPRVRWRNWNLLRAALAVLAFVVNVSAVALLLGATANP